jgi:hypothetical protein
MANAVASDVELTWAAFSDKDIDGFRIYRREQNESYFLLINTQGLIPAWHQDYTDGELPSASIYQYVLGVVTSDGDEALSQPVEVTTSAKSFASKTLARRGGGK